MSAHTGEEESKRMPSDAGKQSDRQASLQRKATRKDSMLRKIVDKNREDNSSFTKLTNSVITSQESVEVLLNSLKEKSYKQNIKSKSRQSETLVIQKHDFFQIVNAAVAEQQEGGEAFTPDQMT